MGRIRDGEISLPLECDRESIEVLLTYKQYHYKEVFVLIRDVYFRILAYSRIISNLF